MRKIARIHRRRWISSEGDFRREYRRRSKRFCPSKASNGSRNFHEISAAAGLQMKNIEEENERQGGLGFSLILSCLSTQLRVLRSSAREEGPV